MNTSAYEDDDRAHSTRVEALVLETLPDLILSVSSTGCLSTSLIISFNNLAYPKGDQSWVFTGRPEVEAETPILWPPDAKSWLIWKDPDPGEGRRRRGRRRMRWLYGITDLMDMGWVDSRSWWWTGRPDVLQFMGSQRVGHNWATELNWTELNAILYSEVFSFFFFLTWEFLFSTLKSLHMIFYFRMDACPIDQ